MTLSDLDEYSPTEAWDRAVQTDPRRAVVAARRLLAITSDSVSRARAHGVIGRACFELGHLALATSEMRSALAAADDSGDDELVANLTLSASAILAESGLVDDALAVLDTLRPRLERRQLGRWLTQRAYVLHHAGRLVEALEHADEAEIALRDAGDELGLLRLLVNRGLVLLQQGRLGLAQAEFDAAEQMATALGQLLTRALAVGNGALALGRARRIPEALAAFDRATALYEEAGHPDRTMAILEIDRAEVLMHAGMGADAVEAAGRALAYIAPGGNLVQLADARLQLARALLIAGDARGARLAAEAASGEFAASGRGAMVPHASAVVMTAQLAGPTVGPDDLAAVQPAIDELERSGWWQQADELRVARLAAGRRIGCYEAIRADAHRLSRVRHDAERAVAMAGWFAEAIRCEHEVDGRAAIAACGAGLDVVDAIVAEAEQLAARSAARRLAAGFGRIALDAAIDGGDPHVVFAVAEGTRARALHDELDAIERLGPVGVDAIVEWERHLRSRLGDRVLVEWLIAGDRVAAVVVGRSGIRLVDVGSVVAITRLRDRTLAWLDRGAIEGGTGADAARRSCDALADAVLRPLRLPADVEIIVVPDGFLHGVPWSGLAASQPITVAPSAGQWLHADRRAGTRLTTAGLLIGTDVGGAIVERAAVEAAYAASVIAGGPGATAASAHAMFGDVDVVHVAAHGRFRSDRPLLSTIEVYGGPASLHELVPARVSTRLVVLSSCESGAQGASDGSEVLGFAAVMLARGAAAVVAPLTVVRDEACASFVAEVHSVLASEVPVARAVARVRERWLSSDALDRWAVACSFTCFGSGAAQVSERV